MRQGFLLFDFAKIRNLLSRPLFSSCMFRFSGFRLSRILFLFLVSSTFFQMKGFPARFETCDQLRTFLKRFLWINIFHTSANYPSYRVFLPASPTRLYQNLDGTDLPFLNALSGKAYNVVSTQLLHILSFVIKREDSII